MSQNVIQVIDGPYKGKSFSWDPPYGRFRYHNLEQTLHEKLALRTGSFAFVEDPVTISGSKSVRLFAKTCWLPADSGPKHIFRVIPVSKEGEPIWSDLIYFTFREQLYSITVDMDLKVADFKREACELLRRHDKSCSENATVTTDGGRILSDRSILREIPVAHYSLDTPSPGTERNPLCLVEWKLSTLLHNLWSRSKPAGPAYKMLGSVN
ncbi:MAG: hypothetical protein ACYCQJ_12550 [Nitrososphaerales archaeon]